MNIEKKFLIVKILSIVLSIIVFALLFIIATQLNNSKEDARLAKIVRGTYISADTFTNISLDDEEMRYYLSGNQVSSGKYKKIDNHVFKLLSGKLKGSYVIKDSNGNITLLESDSSAEIYKKYDNQITIMHE